MKFSYLLSEFFFLSSHKTCGRFSTPQINAWSSDWIEFYGEKRLGYQLKLAKDRYGDTAIYQKGFAFSLLLCCY